MRRPLFLSLTDFERLPSRTQITRHDCVEGWSAIGQWRGVPPGRLLDTAEWKPGARSVVFHCADELEKTPDGSGRYYESIERIERIDLIDLIDAYRPQTLLAYWLNGGRLPVAHGAPLASASKTSWGTSRPSTSCASKSSRHGRRLWGGRGGF